MQRVFDLRKFQKQKESQAYEAFQAKRACSKSQGYVPPHRRA